MMGEWAEYEMEKEDQMQVLAYTNFEEILQNLLGKILGKKEAGNNAKIQHRK